MAKTRRKKIDDTSATMRRFVMLEQIPWEPASISTAEVQAKLEVAGYHVELRTVQRDLSAFSVPFQYSSTEDGGPIRWFWPRHVQPLNIRAITPATALILALAHRHLEPLLPPSALELLRLYFQQADETLTKQDPKRFASWTHKLRVIPRGPTFATPKIPEGVQQAVFDALLADRKIRAVYRGRGARDAKPTDLHPLGVVSRDGVIYLVATAWDYEQPYHYALHRFEKAEALPDTARRPEGFDLDRHIAAEKAFAYPTGRGRIALKIEIDEAPAALLLERPLAPGQTARRLRNGRYQIAANVEDTAELRWWLLGYGEQLRVVGPVSLRRDIVQALTAAAAQYQKAPPPGTAAD
ncbi:MAG: helix-turn-helix transcriptional regulator [Panacagrimonas sp.]